MKIKRYKKAERYMTLYKNNFGFREPYQILIDGTFCQVALNNKVNIQEQLPKYLAGECKLLTTSCVIHETKRLGKPLNGAYQITNQYAIHDCGHEKPVSAAKCLRSFVARDRNKDHYLVATQDHELRSKLSNEVVCPTIKLANNALVLQKPNVKIKSRISKRHDYLANKLKHNERQNLEILKEENSIDQPPVVSRKKTKRPKGPNPLSCIRSKKKKSISMDASSNIEEGTQVRRRRRHRNITRSNIVQI